MKWVDDWDTEGDIALLMIICFVLPPVGVVLALYKYLISHKPLFIKK